MSQIYERELKREELVEQQAYKIAIDGAIQASAAVLPFWCNPDNSLYDEEKAYEIVIKEGNGNFATTADFLSERVINSLIQNDSLVGGSNIRGEEGTDITTDSHLQWIVDPIDGTPNFNAGNPRWGISIGVLKDNEPYIGVVAIPGENAIYVARRQQGIQVLDLEGKYKRGVTNRLLGDTESIMKGLVAFDLGYTDWTNQLREMVGPTAEMANTYPSVLASVTASNIELIHGGLRGYIIKQPTVFDIAAVAVLVPEAGGKVTNLKGEPIDWTEPKPTKGYLAAPTPALHQQLLEMVNR